jgi:predicted nucleotide-binding protein (sugar kinase/HSP70/actin superfamily)
MLSITFLLAAIILCRGNNSMGHAWLLTGFTMRMEQHKVEWIVSRVQATDPP